MGEEDVFSGYITAARPEMMSTEHAGESVERCRGAISNASTEFVCKCSIYSN